MMDMKNPTPEEMQKLVEKAQRDLEEALAKLTPEEREEAERKAKKMIEEDAAKKQALLEQAAPIATGDVPKRKPKFCTNCGAPVVGGKFCTNCGSPLEMTGRRSCITDGGEVAVFRPMRRFKQQVSEAECIRILQQERRGVLSMLGEDGYPYGIPMDHWYCSEDGKLYFHGAKVGHKIDSISRCDKVSYCVYDGGYRKEGEWARNVTSVVVFGRISLVTDVEKARTICEHLCRRFTDDEAYIQTELRSALARVQCLELSIDHMTGKLVKES